MAEEKFGFQAEVGKILEIVANALYSEKQVFLRELVSNASDACDKLRYEAITRPELIAGDPDFKITLAVDAKARTLAVADNGIGMNRDELIEQLGTIARSGTAAFLEQLSGDAAKDMALIGQFGVGFYSAFMVAEKIEVLTRRAGEDQGWRWTSDGKGEFAVAEAGDEAPGRGTRVMVHLKKEAKEFLEPERLKHIVKTYSDHIALPIVLAGGGSEETVNAASALWTRPKKDVTDEQYTEFYRHAGHAFDTPWLTLHYKAEGKIEYAGLVFVPSVKPYDLFEPERRHRVKLYVKRVFITDDCEGLVPPYLRFVKGIVDSEDLPLNISREMLQSNPIVAKIRAALVRRLLSELKKKAEKAPDEYATFWDNFGAVLKEGIYEDPDRREALLELARFRSTAGGGLVSLDAYLERMKEAQEHIYYIAGDDPETLAASPHLEGFLSRGLEVLIMTDPVDEFWMPAVGEYKDKAFKSVTRGGADLAKFPAEPKEAPKEAKGEKAKGEKAKATDAEIDSLVALFKLSLADAVKDVRVSERLTDSPVCLVADEGDMDMHLERILKQHRQIDGAIKRVLEVNPDHAVIRRLAALSKKDGAAAELADHAHLLLDQARIVEGEPLPDPAAFSRRLAGVMAKGLGG